LDWHDFQLYRTLYEKVWELQTGKLNKVLVTTKLNTAHGETDPVAGKRRGKQLSENSIYSPLESKASHKGKTNNEDEIETELFSNDQFKPSGFGCKDNGKNYNIDPIHGSKFPK
jgi:hypothetical protein